MRRARIYLLAILLLHFVVGILGEVHFWKYWQHGGPKGDWLKSPAIYWPPLLMLVYLWLREDVKSRQVQLPFWLPLVAPLLFPIGVPYYYFRTGQLRWAFARSGMFLTFIGMCIAAVWLGNRLAFNYYAVWTNK